MTRRHPDIPLSNFSECLLHNLYCVTKRQKTLDIFICKEQQSKNASAAVPGSNYTLYRILDKSTKLQQLRTDVHVFAARIPPPHSLSLHGDVPAPCAPDNLHRKRISRRTDTCQAYSILFHISHILASLVQSRYLLPRLKVRSSQYLYANEVWSPGI